jgi:hypothetical protein
MSAITQKSSLNRSILACAFVCALFASNAIFAQNVGIGTNNPLDKLHVAGNVRVNPLAGVGNRVAGADANGTLIIFAAGTTGQVLTQTGGGPAWTTSSNDWTVLGNAGTAPATNFLGTTDAQAMVFRTTNVERARISAAGYVVVNNPAPFAGDMFSSYASGGNYAVNGYSTGSGAAGYFSSSATGAAVIGFQSGTLGAAGQFTISGAGANTSPAVDIYNQTGSSPAVIVRTDLANAGADAIELDVNGASAKRGIDMYMDVVTTGIGMTVFHDGTGRCINVQQQNTTNTNPVIFASAASSARVLNATNALTTNTQMIGFFNQGSTGLATATYGNAASVWGQSAGIRSGVFLAAGGSANTTCLMGSYSGAAGNFDGIGVLGVFAPAALYGYGVVGQGNWYGVFANGDVGASGVKPFQIDHPQDPENKYLKHFSLESNEVLNMYRGTVTLDNAGQGTVQLPSYFHAININFSYNLTPIGAAANVYVAQEIDANGTFRIAGGQPGQKICWNVYADRNDPYVQANPLKVQDVVQKRPHEVGYYLDPALYGQPQEKSLFDRYREEPGSVKQVNGELPSKNPATHSAKAKDLTKVEETPVKGSGN